jgi:hypothetical protein
MEYEDDIRKAARRAQRGIDRAIDSLQKGLVSREDDLSGVLKGNLDAELEGAIGSLTWECTIVNHGSGRAADEAEFGADLLIHIRFQTPELKYNKGVLVQAKRVEKGHLLSAHEHQRLVEQCEDMLEHTPAAFVFVYSNTGLRCGSASAIVGSVDRDLYEQSVWTSYRFFLELFRCPIGDPNIVSPYPADLRPKTTVRMTARSGH